MDSILVRHLVTLEQAQDSILTQIKYLGDLVVEQQQESIWIKALPMIGVIVGATISIWGQALLKRKEFDKASAKEIRDSLNKIHANKIQLKYYLHELAYLQVDSRYQYYLSQVIESDEAKSKALEEHYNDYNFIANAREKISTAFSEINAAINSIYSCKEQLVSDEVVAKLDYATDFLLNLKLPKEYDLPVKLEGDNSKPAVEVTESQLQSDISALAAEYTSVVSSVNGILPLLPLKGVKKGKSK